MTVIALETIVGKLLHGYTVTIYIHFLGNIKVGLTEESFMILIIKL